MYGDRGSIDVLAFEPVSGALLVVEVKTVITDVGATLMVLDRKMRHARALAATRGWHARTLGRILVLPETRTARRRVDAHGATFRNAFSARNVEVKRVARPLPAGAISGLLFLSSTPHTGAQRTNRPGFTLPNDPATHNSRLRSTAELPCSRSRPGHTGI